MSLISLQYQVCNCSMKIEYRKYSLENFLIFHPKRIKPNEYQHVLVAGSRMGSFSDWNKLLEIYLNARSDWKKPVMQNALAATTNKFLISK